jgi:hypothetical protein
LRSTIQHLNAHQTNRLLNFRGDGSGQRIVWQAIDSAQAPPVAGRLTIHAA